jgi:hypothetical protein
LIFFVIFRLSLQNLHPALSILWLLTVVDLIQQPHHAFQAEAMDD